jgi:hypothetical protein
MRGAKPQIGVRAAINSQTRYRSEVVKYGLYRRAAERLKKFSRPAAWYPVKPKNVAK